MDSVIKSYNGIVDHDLVVCDEMGVAYQADMTANRVRYDRDYMAKVDAYDGSEIAWRVNRGRCEMLFRHLREGARVLDVGAGSGAFVRAAVNEGFMARGFDVIPDAVERLTKLNLFDDDPSRYDAVTFWDVLEHMDDPGEWLHRLPIGATIFISVPIFTNLKDIRQSKHYRPGEHLYYWTTAGMIKWMRGHDFWGCEFSSHEMAAGRESIGAFAFRRRFH